MMWQQGGAYPNGKARVEPSRASLLYRELRMEHDSSGWTGGGGAGLADRAPTFSLVTSAGAGPAARQAQGIRFLICFGISLTLFAGEIIAQMKPGNSYPDCDNNAVRTSLARLYDNRHLLHVIDVRAIRLINDGWKGRYCSAAVRWDNGSETEVRYEFYRSGRRSQYISTWIDHNGGMRGPSF
jgi:hypothetical protein